MLILSAASVAALSVARPTAALKRSRSEKRRETREVFHSDPTAAAFPFKLWPVKTQNLKTVSSVAALLTMSMSQMWFIR